MALALADRVQETSTTTGTGTLTLAGAVVGYRSFATIGNGNTTYYTITNAAGAWEVGIGTYTSVGTTLSRTTVLSSSNGGSLVSFTGTLNVFVTYPAGKSVNLDASNNLTVLNTAYLGGASGNQSLQVNNVASAVNYLEIVGNTTGNTPIISSQGTDTNLGLAIRSKGTFYTVMQSDAGANIHDFAVVASSVNFFRSTPAIAGAAPAFSAQGSDANISLRLTPKGTGGVWFTGPLLPNNLAGTSGQVLTSAGAGVVPTWTTPTTGTVTGVTATSPVASSGGTAPAISLNAAYGDTLNPYASKTANFILAAPNGSAGVPSFRAIVAADIPTLNQNTTGTAANVTGTVAVANGGTGLTSVTANRLLYGNGTSALQTSANFTYNGTTQAITAGAATALSLTTSGSTASLSIADTGVAGASIGMFGNGATTPNKYFRVNNGVYQIVNNAYSAVIFQLSDTGVISSSTWNGVTIGVAYGGTGLTSVTANRIPYGNGTSAFQTSANLSYNGTSFVVGTATPPTFTGASSQPYVYVLANQLATTLNATSDLLALGNGNGNQNYLRIFQYRNTAAGADWTTATTRIQAITDVTNQGYIDFNPISGNYGLAFGNGSTEYVRILNGGAISFGSSGTATGTSGQVLTSAGSGASPTWTNASSNITTKGLYENNATISANYTIATGNNAVSAGPITINSGIVVTVPSGSTWVVV
jgi:hypothetical protein